MQDFKIAAINTLTFSLSFTGVEQWLKITLLILSIAYTVMKIIKIKNKDNE
tara:strand:- start:968 stop:1120 length:153 start_codon:yes stop_codon:yes gene_type:complete